MKKELLKKTIETAKSSAVDLADKAKERVVQAIDQNDNGKIDTTDLKEIFGDVCSGIKDAKDSAYKIYDEKAYEIQEKYYSPIMPKDILYPEFRLSNLIRVCEPDSKRLEHRVCKGAIGYYTEVRGGRVINIYRQDVDKFNITLIPDGSYDLYYVDPSNDSQYIALDEYFSCLKEQRVAELQNIAHELGAKYFKVTYTEEKISFTKRNTKVGIDKAVESLGIERATDKDNFSRTNIEAEMECTPHEPRKPELVYLKSEASIINLIDMRLRDSSTIKKQQYTIDFKKSSGIKERDAIIVDSFLKKLKCGGNATMESEMKNESRRRLIYEIEF